MIVKNEYVQIQIGNKTYTKRNMILDTYLKKIFESQINPSFDLDADITRCYLKLNTPLENISYDSELSSNNFDIVLSSGIRSMIEGENLFKNNSIRTNNNIVMNYKFTSDGDFQYKTNSGWKNGEKNDFDMFNGKKITNIGFGNSGIYAVLDVSDLNIIINSDEKVIITRVDLYQSDAICSGFDYPLHLVNFTAKYNAKEVDGVESCTIAELYSIGLGNKIGLMEDEDIIDFEQVEIGDTDLTIEMQKTISRGIYPSELLFPRNNLYPKKDNSKYLILKYRLAKIETIHNTKTYLDEYYTMSYRYNFGRYNEQEKTISFNLKIERM